MPENRQFYIYLESTSVVAYAWGRKSGLGMGIGGAFFWVWWKWSKIDRGDFFHNSVDILNEQTKKTHCAVHFKWENLVNCKLYLKVVPNKKHFNDNVQSASKYG